MVEPMYPPQPDIVSSSTPFWACFRKSENPALSVSFFDSLDEALVEFEESDCREEVNPLVQEIRQNGVEIDYLHEKIKVMSEREDLAQSRASEIASQYREQFRKELLDWSQIVAGFGTLIGGLLGFGLGVWFSQFKTPATVNNNTNDPSTEPKR